MDCYHTFPTVTILYHQIFTIGTLKAADKDIIIMDDVALQNYVHQWLQSKESHFFLAWIHALVQRRRKIVVKYVDYVEK
jgi:hypothetical protein